MEDKIIDRPDYYMYDKPELKERTRKRLTEIVDCGMTEVSFAQFGYPEIMSGLYIEIVWNYSYDDFDDYMKWAKDLINSKKEKMVKLYTEDQLLEICHSVAEKTISTSIPIESIKEKCDDYGYSKIEIDINTISEAMENDAIETISVMATNMKFYEE